MLALVAALLLTGSLGSIHAFSVFIAPIEAAFEASRQSVALVYSLALVALTIAVLVSHRVFRAVGPARLILVIGGLCGFGLSLPSWIDTMPGIYAGYGLLFGCANGLGYALALQLAARAYPGRSATAMGAVTAVYALGAMAFAQLFERLIASHDFRTALGAMAGIMLAVGLAGALAARRSRIAITSARQAAPSARAPLAFGRLALLWLGYGTGCLAGLMAIGHAAGIVAATGGDAADASLAVALIALGNAVGGLAAGALADRSSVRRLLALAALLSAIALAGLAFADSAARALACLTLVGLAYGAIIALTPALTLTSFGVALMARAYGLIFTAWGVAGLLGPWAAGALYDAEGRYGTACLLAAVAAAIACGTALRTPAPSR